MKTTLKALKTLTLVPFLFACSTRRSSSGGNYTAATSFYKAREVSLLDAENANSDVDALFEYMSSKSKKEEDKKKWGEKFFIVFVQEDCAGCDEEYKALSVLDAFWGKGEFNKEGSNDTFKMYAIFIDQLLTIDDIEENLFQKYFFDRHIKDFSNIATVIKDSAYANNNKHKASYLTDLEAMTDRNLFATPTTFLYDPNYQYNVTSLGISEVLFNVEGKNSESGAYPMARTLFDCWYHQDIFKLNSLYKYNL